MAKKKALKAKGKAKAKKVSKPAKRPVLKVVAKKANGNGLPKVSSKPWGKDGKALDGVKISTSRTSSRARPARSCWPGSAPT